MISGLRLVDSRAPSGFRELIPHSTRGAIPNAGFTEREAFELYAPGAVGWQLFIDDEPIPGTRVQGHAGWCWRPGFYAGTVRAELLGPGEATGIQYLFDVSPDPQKLGREALQRLIEDVLAAHPALLVGNEPATGSAGGAGSAGNSNVQYAYLFQYGPAFIEALRAVQCRPRLRLEALRINVPPARARRADARTAQSVARSGAFGLLSDVSNDSAVSESVRLDVPFSMESLDSAATRCLAALVHAVLRRAIWVQRSLDTQVAAEADSETTTPLGVRWPRRRAALASLIRELDALLSRTPFAAVRKPEITAAGLTAVAADPVYARSQQLGWRILRPGRPDARRESWTWMSPTWGVYEAWCFVRLAQILRGALPQLTWREAPGGRVMAPSHVEGRDSQHRVRLLYQQTFPSSGRNSKSEFVSISKELRPDLVVAIEAGASSHWFVLDAKYSQSRSAVLGAMHSAHLYHDALRWRGAPPLRSLLLVPSCASEVQWLRERAFWHEHSVGAGVCAPDITGEIVEEIRQLVQPAGRSSVAVR